MHDHTLSSDKKDILTPAQKVSLARNINRPHIDDFIHALFTDFFEQKGDHLYDEDRSILGGIARYHGIPVTVVGHRKGHNAQDNVAYNFGMPCPEGYRKALRIMEQADKFHRPIITFVDTPGAYPGKEAEEHGQGEAIARNLAVMSRLSVPVICVVTGEGNSGGALALSVANKILMLENAVYSVLSPEGFASILWKDKKCAPEAADKMKLTAEDVVAAQAAERMIKEPEKLTTQNMGSVLEQLREELRRFLKQYAVLEPEKLCDRRYERFRKL